MSVIDDYSEVEAMTKARSPIILPWLVGSAYLWVAFESPKEARAEAGISEAARAKDFWVKKPFALNKSGDRDLGPDRVNLYVGRDAAPDERGWYGDIMHVRTLIEDVRRFAITPRYLLMQLNKDGSYAAIDLNDAGATPVYAPDEGQILKAIHGPVVPEVLNYRSFEDCYFERVVWPAWKRATAYGGVLSSAMAVSFWLRRRCGLHLSVRSWSALIAGLYAVAMAMPAIDIHRGWLCLIFFCFPPWWANFFLLAGVLCMFQGYRKWAFASGVIASLLAATTLPIMGTEAVRIGYWLWQAIMGLLVLAADDQRCRARALQSSLTSEMSVSAG